VFYTSGFLYLPTPDNSIFFLLRNIGPVFTVVPRGGEARLIAPNSAKATAERFCTIKDRRFYAVSPPAEMRSASQSRKATFSVLQILKENLADKGISLGRVGVEGLDLPFNFHLALREAFPKVQFVDAQDLFFEMRAVKSPSEVDRVRQAVQMAVAGLNKAFDTIREGMTEREILNTYKAEVVRRGGSWCNTKFCAGKANGATISHQASDYAIRPGDPAIFDVGAVFQGYASDLARVGYLGKREEEGVKLYEVLRAAQETAIKAIRPGVSIADVFNIAQEHVRQSGYPDYTRGNIGHGVGIDFEEEPFIAPGSSWKIQSGMILAVELPFYSSKLGGFNVEDVVYVSEKGAEVLSSSLSKEARILG
jgi:Xaa-Pro aminopeptidase